jgi:hypothetical protein
LRSRVYARDWSSVSDDVELLVFDRPGIGAALAFARREVGAMGDELLSIWRLVCMCIDRAYSRRRSVASTLASISRVWAAYMSWEAGMLGLLWWFLEELDVVWCLAAWIE